MPDRRDNALSPATATGLANSEFESFFNIKGTRNHRVDSYPFIKGKLDVYSLIFFPSSGRGILHMVEADGALVARTVNARDDNGQLIIHRFVDALSGSGAYANLVRAIGHYTQGFDGEVVANDINPLIPLAQWTLLNRRPELEQELRTVVNQIAAIAANFKIHINETNLRILPNRQEGDPRLSNAEWNERFRAQTGTDADPEAPIRLARFRDAVKNYFNTELIACHQPGAATNDPPTIMYGKEVRASALFYIAQWGIPSQYNVGHSLLRQHPMRLSTWREYYLPIDIVRRKNSYTPHVGQGPITAHNDAYLLNNRLPKLHAIMTEIDKFYAKGINLYTTLFTHDNGLNLARSATHGSLVLISDYLNETVRIDKPNQQLVSSVFTGWGNGGRFVITDNYTPQQAEFMQRLGFNLVNQNQTYLIATNYDIQSHLKSIKPIGSGEPQRPLPPPDDQPAAKRHQPQALYEFIPPDPDSPIASTSTGLQHLLPWRTIRDQIAQPFGTQGRKLNARVRHAPQAIWLDTDPAATRLGRCNGLALAWALAPDSPAVLDNLFTAAAHPAAPAAQAFRLAIDQLHAPAADRAPLPSIQSLPQAIDHLMSQPGERALLIHIGNHSVALAAHGAGDATRLAFFDPNAGVWSDIADPAALKQALLAHFSTTRLADYASDGSIRAFSVEAPAPNSARNLAWQLARTPLLPDIEIQARQDRRWGPLRIGSEHISRARLFHADAAAATAPRPSRALARAGSGLRMYGAWRALLSIRDHALHGQYAELGLELGALTALGTAEGIERGLPRLARHLPQVLNDARLVLERSAPALARRLPARLGQQALRMFTLSADATRVSAPSLGRLLARGAGVIGNLLTLPFDLYSAIRNFCQLNRLQGLARQDAIVAGSLASIGAGTGLALAGASALGASLSVVGPLGLGLGALMIASTQLYAAVRQVQEVKQWITLSSGEEAMLGLRSFVAPGTLDRATAQRVQQARHETLLQQNAQRILSAPGEHAAGVVLCPRPRVHSRLIAATCDEDHQHEHLALGDTATPLHARTSPLSYFDAARICPRRGASGHRHSGRYGYEVYVQSSDDQVDYAAGPGADTITVSQPAPNDTTAHLLEGNGHDRLTGHDGTDTFRLSGRDEADGGADDDLYLVDRLQSGDQVRIADSGHSNSATPERNVIYLAMSMTEFRHARMIDRALVLTFTSGATLTIQELYRQQDQRWMRREARFSALTADGWALFPALPASLDDGQQNIEIDVAAHHQPEALAHLLEAPGIQALMRRNQERQRPVLFNFGSGNDTLTGAPQRRNIFLLGSGNMTVTGGGGDDILTLNATPDFAVSGINGYDTASRRVQAQQIGQYRYRFDGGAGNDTLQLTTRFADTPARGYRVDLAAQRIELLADGDAPPIVLGTLSNFENLVASPEARAAHTRHELQGDQHANLLIGAGQDRLEGRGGDDILQASDQAEAYGGEGDDLLQLSGRALGAGGAGQDRYLIGRLTADEHVAIQDGQGDSVVQLNFGLQQIRDWQIVARNLVLTLRCGATITVRDVDQPGMVSFITQDGFILDPEFPAAGDATDFPIVAHYVKQLDSAYATDGQGVVLNLEQRTLSAHPGTAPAPEGARVVGRRQGRITHTGSQAIVLNCDAGDVRLRLRYQALDDQPVGEQLLSFSQFEFILSMEGTELVFDALPWLESPDLALRGGQGQLRCQPGFPPHITSRDGYQLSWIGADGFTFRPAPGHQAIIEQALALRDEHRSIHGSAPEALINRFSAMEIGASTHEATVSLIRAPAPVIPWQAAGAMTLDARYRLLGAGSAHDDILIGATNEDALNLLLGHAGDDQLIAGASGGLLCGGDGADRYRIDLAMAMPESHYLDNLASDGTVDTLEVRGASAWHQLTLARAEDDLWLGMRPTTPETALSPALVVLDYYRQPERRHLALELTGSDGTLRTRLSASELEQAALDGQTPTVVAPYPRPAALEQLISQMARMNATSPDADIRAQETITQPPAPAHLLMPT